jgi:hypothetical protein
MTDSFPTWKFKRIIVLGGMFRATSGPGDRAGGDSCFGIAWAAIQRAELGPVVTTMARVLADHARHGLVTKHFPVWLAMETGIILQDGLWHYAFANDPRIVMDDRQTALLFEIAESTARTYRDEFARALDREWWIVTRFEDWSTEQGIDLQVS